METITKAAAAAASAVAETAVKTLKMGAPVIAPEGRRPTNGELLNFFENRALKPEFYTFDPKGNLIVKEELAAPGKRKGSSNTVPGVVKQTYTIPPYRPITQEERDAYSSKQIDTVRDLETQFDNALVKLRDFYTRYKGGDDDVEKLQIVNANKEIAALDAQRHAAMYPVRQVYKIDHIPITSILLEASYDKGKTFGDSEIKFLRRSTVPLSKLYVSEGTEVIPEAPVSTSEASSENSGSLAGGGRHMDKKAEKDTFAQQLAKDLKIILFAQPEDNEYGFLSTFYPVEFVLNGIKYFTVEQALAAEKARLFLEDELRGRIMKTRAPRSMRTMANNIVRKSAEQTGGMRAIELHEWDNKVRLDVMKNATLAKFKQHPDLKERLMRTGDAILAWSDTREKRDGTGVAMTDALAADVNVWKGGNRYGQILMEVRSQLREEERENEEPVAGGAGTEIVRESVISGGDYTAKIENARKAAIINRVRNRVGVSFA